MGLKDLFKNFGMRGAQTETTAKMADPDDGTLLHIEGDGKLVMLKSEDGGFTVQTTLLNSLDKINGVENLDQYHFTDSTTEGRLKFLYDIAEEKGLVENKDAGVLVKINAPFDANFELLVTRDDNGATHARVVTDSFLSDPENKALYDTAKGQSPLNFYERSGLRFKHVPTNDEEKASLVEKMDRAARRDAPESTVETATPISTLKLDH
ncbi:MAG: hypothetical protein KDJ35_03835 [Alphaproteobacteria bacterium]|nr:hypothetical protein [Alphaproteobacteria bacterium]